MTVEANISIGVAPPLFRFFISVPARSNKSMNLIRRARRKSEIEKIHGDDTAANFQSAFFRLIDRYSSGIDSAVYRFAYACRRVVEDGLNSRLHVGSLSKNIRYFCRWHAVDVPERRTKGGVIRRDEVTKLGFGCGSDPAHVVIYLKEGIFRTARTRRDLICPYARGSPPRDPEIDHSRDNRPLVSFRTS